MLVAAPLGAAASVDALDALSALGALTGAAAATLAAAGAGAAAARRSPSLRILLRRCGGTYLPIFESVGLSERKEYGGVGQGRASTAYRVPLEAGWLWLLVAAAVLVGVGVVLSFNVKPAV